MSAGYSTPDIASIPECGSIDDNVPSVKLATWTGGAPFPNGVECPLHDKIGNEQ